MNDPKVGDTVLVRGKIIYVSNVEKTVNVETEHGAFEIDNRDVLPASAGTIEGESVIKDSWTEVPVLKHDLRAILFWASVGIKNSYTGSYRDAEGENGIIDSYAQSLNFRLPYKPVFKKAKP